MVFAPEVNQSASSEEIRVVAKSLGETWMNELMMQDCVLTAVELSVEGKAGSEVKGSETLEEKATVSVHVVPSCFAAGQ